MKILVVDDEALLVKGIRFNLKSEGYDVITGSNGQEAVEMAQKEQPDLIVLDVMMPVMDRLQQDPGVFRCAHHPPHRQGGGHGQAHRLRPRRR